MRGTRTPVGRGQLPTVDAESPGHGWLPAPRDLVDERDDLVDDLVEGVRRGVEVDRTLGHHRRRHGTTRVDRVAAQQVGLGRLDRPGTVLRRTTGRAGRRVGGQVDLDLRVGGHHRADVTPLDDDAALADDRALQLEQPAAYLRDGRDGADVVGDRLGADLDRDVAPSTVIVGFCGSVPDTISGSSARAAMADGSEKSTPCSIIQAVIARNWAPVSR